MMMHALTLLLAASVVRDTSTDTGTDTDADTDTAPAPVLEVVLHPVDLAPFDFDTLTGRSLGGRHEFVSPRQRALGVRAERRWKHARGRR